MLGRLGLAGPGAMPGTGRALDLMGLGAVLVLGGWLRLIGLERVGLIGDEAVYSGQAAALAGDPARGMIFGIFLAHPVLAQLGVGALMLAGGGDEVGRYLVALTGTLTLLIAYLIGRQVGGRWMGLGAALLLAVLAYHVALSRLVFLDVPAALFVGAALYGTLRAARDRSAAWLAAAAFSAGLALLVKEIAVFAVLAALASALVDRRLRLGLRAWAGAVLAFLLPVSAYPISLLVGGGLRSTLRYLGYQLSRSGQSDLGVYLELVGPYLTLASVLVAALGLAFALRQGGDRRLVAVWFVVPMILLQLWGLREMQLAILVSVPFCVLILIAIDGLAGLVRHLKALPASAGAVGAALAVALVLALGGQMFALSLDRAGLPAGHLRDSGLRRAATWIRDHAAPGSGVFVSTVHKSSVVAFYARRQTYGFSPARRHEPMYVDFDNDAERLIRAGAVRYVILDEELEALASGARRTLFLRTLALLERFPSHLVLEAPGSATEQRTQVHAIDLPEPANQASWARPPVPGRGRGGLVAAVYAVAMSAGAAFVVWLSRRERSLTS